MCAASALTLLLHSTPWAQNPPSEKTKEKSSKPAQKPTTGKSRGTRDGIKAPKRLPVSTPPPQTTLPAATQTVLPAPPRPNPSIQSSPDQAGTAPALPLPMSKIDPLNRPEKPVKIDPLAQLPTGSGLWGYADLHVHPASHLAFGANEEGNGGIFWGKPGLALESANIGADLPPCNNDSHYGFDLDYVRKGIRNAVLEKVSEITGHYHGSDGFPRFQAWPHSQSLIHQQMHITMIKRAYDGGLRLMVASVTDNQLMSKMWTQIGFNLFGNPVPKPESEYEYKSARRQLEFIRRLAAANSSWMQVVTSAAEARLAIKSNRLAVVLGVEMDSLTADQILVLAHQYGVRQVVPIHLINNAFGGTAVYNEIFNATNNWMNGSFLKVTNDPLLQFRLERPLELKGLGLLDGIQGLLGRGGVAPNSVSDEVYNALGYASGTGGHKNTLGLNGAPLEKLMRAGFLIDVAHMSELATEQALALAERFQYPLMNSHTDLRSSSAHSERDMTTSAAKRLARLGGVVGLGTATASGDDYVFLDVKTKQKDVPVVRFTGDIHEWPQMFAMPKTTGAAPLYSLTISITTGGDDLRGGNNDNVDVIVFLRNGQRLQFQNINRSITWPGNTTRVVTRILPGLAQYPKGIYRSDIAGVILSTHFTGGLFGDNWNVDAVRLTGMELGQDTVGQWLAKYNAALSATRWWQGTVGRQGGVAFGTDINGFAPQIPIAATTVSYPITVAFRYKPTMTGSVSQAMSNAPPALPPCQIGSKTYDLRRDGLAHFGMLPDFLQALSQKPGSDYAMQALYRSANDVVKMWEIAEASGRKMANTPLPRPGTPPLFGSGPRN